MFRLLAVLTCLCFLAQPGIARRKAALDLPVLDLINSLASKPELLRLEYLQYFIGRPFNERAQRGLTSKAFYWYGLDGKLRYELQQSEPAPGQLVESTMVMHLPGSTLDLNEVSRMFGANARHFYDYSGHANALYSFAPNTFLVFTNPKDAFAVDTVKVSYRGDPLPPLSAADLEGARQKLMDRARELVEKGRWEELEPLLALRLSDRPEDGEARYQLARAYARRGRLHDAISQYRAALATASTQPSGAGGPLSGEGGQPAAALALGSQAVDLRQRCLQALQELGVIPADEGDEQDHLKHHQRFSIVNKGQRIRVKGTENLEKSRQDAGASPNRQASQ